eukprot:800274-Amphidinium_carterae.2
MMNLMMPKLRRTCLCRLCKKRMRLPWQQLPYPRAAGWERKYGGEVTTENNVEVHGLGCRSGEWWI